jgi:hypothetical protein
MAPPQSPSGRGEEQPSLPDTLSEEGDSACFLRPLAEEGGSVLPAGTGGGAPSWMPSQPRGSCDLPLSWNREEEHQFSAADYALAAALVLTATSEVSR